MIKSYKNFIPEFGNDCFVAETAVVLGDVKMGSECSVWYSAVIRGDVNRIRIGDRVNIQDCSCLHTSEGEAYLEIGNDVTIGHNVCLHGAKVKDHVLIGMGATILDCAEIGSNSVIAAGALVLQNTKIGEYELWGGVPAKLIKKLTPDDIKRIIDTGLGHYVMQTHVYLSDEVKDVQPRVKML